MISEVIVSGSGVIWTLVGILAIVALVLYIRRR